MYVYTNDLLISRMNDYDLFFGESGYVHTDDTWHSEKVCSPYSRISKPRAAMYFWSRETFI